MTNKENPEGHKEFNLSEKERVAFIESVGLNLHYYKEESVKEFIRRLREKVLLNWKGQSDFIDFLYENAGEKLI